MKLAYTGDYYGEKLLLHVFRAQVVKEAAANFEIRTFERLGQRGQRLRAFYRSPRGAVE
jgi:hypothetical protein